MNKQDDGLTHNAGSLGQARSGELLAKKQLSLLTYGNHLVTILETRWLHSSDT